MAAGSADSFTFTVGKLDAGMAILIGERAHLIEFPSLLLPPGVTSGSIVNIAVHRNADEEHRQKQEFWDLQEELVKTFGRDVPEAPKVEVRNVTQTSVTLEWPPLKMATAKLRSLDIYRNGQRLASVPSPMTNTTSRLSGLALQTQYTFQLILRTTAGTFPSNIIRVTTHSINDTSGISVCFGNVQDGVLLERAKMCLKEMGARWSDRIQIDTTHFVCSTPAAIPTPGSSGSISGPGVEYQRALQASIPVVQPQWIIACYSEKKMVPIASYYLGSSPSAPISNAPFTRPAGNASRTSVASPPQAEPARRQSAPPPAPGATLGEQQADAHPPAIERSRSPETVARTNASNEPAVKEGLQKVEEADEQEAPSDSAQESQAQAPPARSTSESPPASRPRNGTMKKDFRFPPPDDKLSAPPPVPAIAQSPVAIATATLAEPVASEPAEPAAAGDSAAAALTTSPPTAPAPLSIPLPKVDPAELMAKPTVPELAISPPAEDLPELKQTKVAGGSPEDDEDIGDVVDVDLS